MKKPENLEFKLLMKNIKRNKNMIDNKIKARQENKLKREEQNKRLNQIRERNELNMKSKKIDFYKRQMSRDLKDLQKRYQILNYENEIYINNNNEKLKNKKAGIEINSFSNIHRLHQNEVKNNFYKKNKNLKFFMDDNKNEKTKEADNKINNMALGGKLFYNKKMK